MKLTRAECIYLIEKAGMEVKEENVRLNAYRDRILYKDEQIGTVYYDSVSLSPHYDYDDSPVNIQYREENAVERLEKALKLIVNYDAESELRTQRVNEVRKYFNQRKINAAIAKIPGPDELAPVNPSAGYEELSFHTPPSIERLME